MVCFNGAAIYDFNDEKLLWASTLDKGALKCVEYMDKMFDFVGIEVCTSDKIYFCKVNQKVREHQVLENLPDNFLDYHDIKEDWVKVLFMVEENEIQQIRDAIANSPFVTDYEFVQSSPWYYELLPKNASKGEGLMHLADLMNVDRSNTIGIGDNENDLALVKMANVGVAVSNAVDEVKEVADFITVDNNSSAVAAVIYALDDGELNLNNVIRAVIDRPCIFVVATPQVGDQWSPLRMLHLFLIQHIKFIFCQFTYFAFFE